MNGQHSGTPRGRWIKLALVAGMVALPATAVAVDRGGGAPRATLAADVARIDAQGPRSYDVRETPSGRRRVAERSAGRRAAQARLRRSIGSGAIVGVDPVTGTPRVVMKRSGFLTGRRRGAARAIALDYVRRNAAAFGLDGDDLTALRVRKQYTTRRGLTHIEWAQTYRGISAFDNGLRANLQGGRLVNLLGSPVPDLRVPSPTPALSAADAVRRALRDVGVERPTRALSQRGPSRETILTGGNLAELTLFVEGERVRLAWSVVAVADDQRVYRSVVDASTGAVLKRANLVVHATGRVFANYPGAPAGGTQQDVSFRTAGDDPWLTGSFDRLRGDNARVYSDEDDNLGFDCDEEDQICFTLPPPGAGDEIPPSSGGGTEGAAWSYPQTPIGGSEPGRSCPPAGCSWNGFSTPRNWTTNRNQNGTQLFFYVNNFHDYLQSDPAILFDDRSGNFEETSSGGVGSDPLIAQADDGADTGSGARTGLPRCDYVNNASMIVLPESAPVGFRGAKMEMFLFTAACGPAGVHDVNGGDDAVVVYHEYAHGLSERLIDPEALGGLFTPQGGAMAEGWSDWYALDYLGDPRQNPAGALRPDAPAPGDLNLGAYEGVPFRSEGLDCRISDGPPGCPGTASAGPGGYTYGDFGLIFPIDEVNNATGQPPPDGIPDGQVHADGEIWGQALWDLRRALIQAHGEGAGISRARGLITDAMRLSPPDPTFLDMRDAILAADRVDGLADCARIWAIFAARGMGANASTAGPNDTRPTQGFANPAATACPAAGGGGGSAGGGSGTAGGGGAALTPTPPARASFAGSTRSIRVDRRGRFSFTFGAGPGLTGSAVFRSLSRVLVGSRRRRVTLARRSFTVPASGRVRLRIRLSRRNLRILRRNRRITVVVTVTLTRPGGLSSTARTRLRLRAPRR